MGFNKSLASIRGDINELRKRPIKVYDVDERDPEKKLLGVFDTLSAASRFTGASTSNINHALKTKGRNRKNTLGKTIAFR
jgi:hypothetical protein